MTVNEVELTLFPLLPSSCLVWDARPLSCCVLTGGFKRVSAER
jgi:hypothetical protein